MHALWKYPPVCYYHARILFCFIIAQYLVSHIKAHLHMVGLPAAWQPKIPQPFCGVAPSCLGLPVSVFLSHLMKFHSSPLSPKTKRPQSNRNWSPCHKLTSFVHVDFKQGHSNMHVPIFRVNENIWKQICLDLLFEAYWVPKGVDLFVCSGGTVPFARSGFGQVAIFGGRKVRRERIAVVLWPFLGNSRIPIMTMIPNIVWSFQHWSTSSLHLDPMA